MGAGSPRGELRGCSAALTALSLRRLEYDAYRTDLEELSMGPRDASTLCRLDAAQSQFQSHKDKYEKLRADVAIKLKFLEENKVGRAVGLGRGCGRRAGVCYALTFRCLAAACPGSVFGWAADVRPAGMGRGHPSLPAFSRLSGLVFGGCRQQPRHPPPVLRPCSLPLPRAWAAGPARCRL